MNKLKITAIFFSIITAALSQGVTSAETGDHTALQRQTSEAQKDAQPSQDDFEVATAKLVTWDAPPNDPGHVELDSAYTLTGARQAWKSNGSRHSRGLLLTHSFDETFFVGVVKNLDVFVGEGFAIQTDKENNYNEVKGLVDPATGEDMEDSTMGPAHGHGIKDLTTGARWRFYNNESKQLSLAYVPQVQIPIGRRSNFDHLGPSQGFTSMDNRLVMTKNFGRLNTDVNLAYSVPFAKMKRTDNYCGTLNTNLAFGYQLTRWLQPEIEFLYNHSFNKTESDANLFSMVFGLIMPVNSHVRLDVGMIQDILGSNANQTTSGYFRLVLTA